MSKKKLFKTPKISNVILTRNNSVNSSPILTNKVECPFIISFKYKLENGYSFKELKPGYLKLFQSFLDKVSTMTFSQVDKMYRRQSDTKDIYNSKQVIHYWITETFRIHGIEENSRFKIIRIDRNHKFHK